MKNIFLMSILVGFLSSTVLAESITLEGTLRDFNQNHVDFEPVTQWDHAEYGYRDYKDAGLEKGNVEFQLGEDHKPKLNPSSRNNFKPQKLEEWFSDVDGVNMRMPLSIELRKLPNGLYQTEIETGKFFPADGKLFGRESYHGERGREFKHNFHMTYELHTRFTYQKGQTFDFSGDDDVWVFINKKLAIDLGGLHSRESESVDLDDLNLREGETYQLDFFWAERHTTASNFMITTSIELESNPVLSIEDTQVQEDIGMMHMMVNLSAPVANDVTFSVSMREDSAKDGEDYDSSWSATTATIKAGELATSIAIMIQDDTKVESDESFLVDISDFVGLAQGNLTAVGTIIDNDRSTTGTCYAMSDNNKNFYIVSMSPNASPLPVPIEKSMRDKFNGEGSAYRARDNNLYAFQAYSDDKGPSDLYVINTETSVISPVKKGLLSDAVDGAEFYYDSVSKKEILYVISGEKYSKLYAFDTTDWSKLEGYPKNLSGDTTGVSSIAIDPASGEAYGIDDYNYNKKKPNLYKIDLTSGRTTHIVQLNQIVDAEGLAYADDGNLYVEDEKYIDGRKIYKVSLIDGSLTPSAILGGSGDIEGLSCNGGESLIPPSITMANAQIIESNDVMKMQIELSKVSDEDVTFSVRIAQGSASDGVDYDSSWTVVRGKILAGEKSTMISIMILDDSDVETDETFIVEVTDIVGALEEKIEAIGTIIDNDHNFFTAFDKDEQLHDKPVIKTKKVGKAFSLELARIKDASHYADFFDDTKNTKVRVVDAAMCGVDIENENGFVSVEIDGKKHISHDFTVNQAMRNAKVQFLWEDLTGETYTACSADAFSVRPDHFAITVSPNGQDTMLKAGKAFTIMIEAQDENSQIISSYTGVNQASYALDYNESLEGNDCYRGVLSRDGFAFSPVMFNSGVAVIPDVKYSEVGQLTFEAYEVLASAYALVDKDDTAQEDRLISKGSIVTGEFTLAKISLTTSFSSDASDQNFVFYSQLEEDEMDAKLTTAIIAQNADGETVKNFKAACYAKDVAVRALYNMDGQSGLTAVLRYTETQSGEPSLNSSYLEGSIAKELFTDGKGTQTIRVNFQRDKKVALNPMKMTIANVNVAVSGLTQDMIPTGSEKRFIYLRAHVASPQTNVGKNKDVRVDYEVYCDGSVDNKSAYGLEGLHESADEVDWYIIDAGLRGGLDYESLKTRALSGKYTNVKPDPDTGPVAADTHTTLYHTSNISMNIIVPKLPAKNRVFYTPTREYLLFNPIGNEHAFRINFFPDTQQWIGKGNLGMTVDRETSTGNGLRKMEW